MKTKFLFLVSVIALSIGCGKSFGAVTLTTFGSSASPTFVVDESTSFADTQNPANLQITGNDGGNLLAGTFSSVDITGFADLLTITGSASSHPASAFSVRLFDSSFSQFATFIGGSWDDLAANGSTTLVYSTQTGGFDLSDISGMELLTSGTGDSVNATLTGMTVSAIPEPSRLLFLGFAGIWVMFRRRRSGS